MKDTSLDAFDSIRESLSEIRRAVYDIILESGSEGITAQEMEIKTGMRRSTISGRPSELVERGLIYDSGLRRKTTSGNSAIVWRAVIKGVEPAPVINKKKSIKASCDLLRKWLLFSHDIQASDAAGAEWLTSLKQETFYFITENK